jgi:hypothetical protein
MGRGLKCKDEGFAAAQQMKRQRLQEARIAAEEASHLPELMPVWCCSQNSINSLIIALQQRYLC